MDSINQRNTDQTLLQQSGNVPLRMDFMNIFTFLMFYSPIILVVFVLSISFIAQNMKGMIYLGFLIFICFLRGIFIKNTNTKETTEYKSPNALCNMVQYTRYGNAGFSIFVISFTLMYLCMPMFLNGSINYTIFAFITSYLIADIAIRYSKKCFTNLYLVFTNILAGAVLGLTIPTIFYSIPTGANYMFFNEMSVNKDVCSMPKKQKFVCKTYRNGELINA